jgi:phenylacetate-CoA ligase
VSDLKRILSLASTHPWYRDIGAGERLADWPVLKKEDLYSRLASARAGGLDRGALYYSRSGGTTTGRPLFFPAGIEENHAQRRKIARHLGASGVLSRASTAVNVCPIVRMYRTMEIFTEIGELCGATMLPMAAIAEDEEVAEIAIQFGANTLIGMPSRLVAFARFLHEKEIALRIDTILFGGEFLPPGKRRLLSSVLGAKRFSALYGSAELGIVAWQSDLSEAPIYRFPRDILHVEIVSPDADGYGAIVATNLLRERFPIIRYDTGDVGRIVESHGDAVTIELQGRQSDSFLIGENDYTVGDFAAVLADVAEFQIQIHFDEARFRDVIRFCLVPGELPVPEEKRVEVERTIREILQGHESVYWAEVALVGPESLVRAAGTSKTPAIVDSRGR